MDVIDFVGLINVYNHAKQNNELVPKRYIRDMKNPIDFYKEMLALRVE